MAALTDPTTPPATPERTQPTMITPTCTENVSPGVMRGALVKGAASLRCLIRRQTAEDLAEPRAGFGYHPLGNTTGSRDAP